MKLKLIPAHLVGIALLMVSGALCSAEALPDLGQPIPLSPPVNIRPGPNGIGVDGGDRDNRFSVQTETSRYLGTSISANGATVLNENLVMGGGMQWGERMEELYLNLGWLLSPTAALTAHGGN